MSDAHALGERARVFELTKSDVLLGNLAAFQLVHQKWKSTQRVEAFICCAHSKVGEVPLT